jgi:VanZ family protein
MGSWPRHARWAPLALALLLQLIVLYAPSTPEGPGLPGFDKVVHVGVFLLPALFGVLAGVPLGWLGALLVAHAVVSEILQDRFLPGRAGDVWDVVADLVGVAIGLALGAAIRSTLRRRATPSPAAPAAPPEEAAR